jgi:hypothetical protein
MGYTHYWQQTRDLTKDEMLTIGAKVRNIINVAEKRTAEFTDYSGYPKPPVTKQLPIVICGGGGDGSPVLTKDTVALNGEGPNLDHETFYLQAKRELPYEGANPDRLGWSFCKTARKPYDVVVVACLTFLSTDYGFKVSSDGDHEELQPGVDLCCEALGREYAHPLTVEMLTS